MNVNDIKFPVATVVAVVMGAWALYNHFAPREWAHEQDTKVISPVVKQLEGINKRLGRQISQTTAPNIAAINELICKGEMEQHELAALKRSRAALETEYLAEAGRDFYEFAQVERCP
jgi:hypothetical protein